MINKIKKPNNYSRLKNFSTTLPIVSTPLLAYYAGDTKDQALVRLINKMRELKVPIPKSYSNDPITKSGLDFASKGSFCRNINNANISTSDKNDLLYMVTFTSNEHDIDDYVGDSSDILDDDHGIIDSILDFLDDLF